MHKNRPFLGLRNNGHLLSVVGVQLLRHIWLSVTPRSHAKPPYPSLSPKVRLSVHWISDVIQPSHPLPPSFPFAFSLFQHQGLFQWVDSLHQVAKVLKFQLQHQTFTILIPGWFPLGLTGLISLLSKGLSRVFSITTTQEHHFFSVQPSLWSSSHIHTWLVEKP